MNGTLAVPAARVSHAAVLSESIFVVGVFAVTVGLAAANGGYFPVSWGWSALALFFAAATALILRSTTRLGRLELVFLGFITALVAWTLGVGSLVDRLSSSILEGQRGLVLIGAVVAVLVLAPASPVRPLLGSVTAATTVICAYALATRLFPERIGSYDSLAAYRLNTPIGYWNGLGVFAALGAVLALGFAARGAHPVARAAGAASLLVLVPTLYFTFSRGAWLAGFAGLVVLFALDPRRLQLAATALCVLPWPALAVALASRSHALTRQSSILPSARTTGIASRSARRARRMRRSSCTRRAARSSGVLPSRVRSGSRSPASLSAFCSPRSVPGSPVTAARLRSRAKPTTRSPRCRSARPTSTHASSASRATGASISGTSPGTRRRRIRSSAAEPGAMQRYYLAHRHTAQQVQDAHSLYLETLAELGPLGLALLVALLHFHSSPLFGCGVTRSCPSLRPRTRCSSFTRSPTGTGSWPA